MGCLPAFLRESKRGGDEESKGGREGEMKRRNIRTQFELEVYQIGFEASMRIFELSKTFPPEERYALTDQVRRSSRAVCAILAEAWRKRRYPAAFVNKLSD